MEDHTISSMDLGDRVVHLVESLGRIDLDNLRDEIQETGAECLWWGEFSARAKRRANEAKMALDLVEATLGLEKRKWIINQGEKITEDFVRSLVKTDPKYTEAQKVWLDAVENSDKIESAKFTIARKQETLQALAPLLFAEEGARRVPHKDIERDMRAAHSTRTPMTRGG